MKRSRTLGPHLNGKYKNINLILEATQTEGALWLGDRHAARDKTSLRQRGIKTVITVAQELFVEFYPNEKIEHKKFDLHDKETEDLMQYIPQTNACIAEARLRGGVFVHCAQGVSRSASVVIAYLMMTNAIGFTEAFNELKLKRSCICPNPGFRKQLEQYGIQFCGPQQETLPQQRWKVQPALNFQRK